MNSSQIEDLARKIYKASVNKDYDLYNFLRKGIDSHSLRLVDDKVRFAIKQNTKVNYFR